MKKFLIIVSVFLLGATTLFACLIQWRFSRMSKMQFSANAFTIHSDVTKANKELGHRIFHVRNGCVECHGPDLSGAMVMENSAMGHIWGANITPFNLSGWSDEEIARAIRYGIHKDGRSLRFMPSFDFEGLSKGDIAAVVAYIRSVPPVEKPSHSNSFGPIARVLSALGKMPVMFPALAVNPEKSFAEKPAEAGNARFGEYLARSCSGCHGPEYRGGPIPGGDPSWPDASSIRLGANTLWTAQNFRTLISTGISPRTNKSLRPPMPLPLLRQMNETEISALWQYLSILK